MNTKIKNVTISVSNYQKILKQIRQSVLLAQSEIVKTVTRKKVEMAWQIGKIIDANLPKNNEEQYGKKLMEQLEEDTSISRTVLYKMRNFYKAYPKIPKDDAALNWSHYRVLSGIKKAEERKYLEDLTKENSWNSDVLQSEARKNKTVSKKVVVKKIIKKITPTRGQLFLYKIKKLTGPEKYFLDCGFGVFREIEEKLPHALRQDGEIVSVSKDAKYSLKKSAINPKQLHTYKAYLERVVDGDTIRVNLDLGFGIFHHEILRLAKIAAPEMSEAQGKKSAAELQKILHDVPFLVVKSIKTDIYGRYVADVFLGEKELETNPQKIADEGKYLNQILLDLGVVKIFE